MSELTLDVERRESSGKNETRRLRASGKVPGVVYGTGGVSVSIQIDRIEINGVRYAPLQILTVDQILAGEKPRLPHTDPSVIYKKAGRAAVVKTLFE